jgi:hypothetical protein
MKARIPLRIPDDGSFLNRWLCFSGHYCITHSNPIMGTGEIMRRFLRKLFIDCGRKVSVSDLSTLADPTFINMLIEKFEASQMDK